MKCCNCPYYEFYSDFNKCDLLYCECYREVNNCKIVNDDGTINEIEYEKAKEYMW